MDAGFDISPSLKSKWRPDGVALAECREQGRQLARQWALHPLRSLQTSEMTERRLRQANLFGPAGFVSADDGEVIEFSQQAFDSKPQHRALAELGGREVGETDHMVTETLIRGMYEYWRKVMEAPERTPEVQP